MTAAETYARWALEPGNEIKTGRLVKQACRRFLSDLERDDIYFDEKEASHCINFIENYCLQWEGDWRGQPFTLEPWQKFALQNIYGWIKKPNGKRRFTKVYIQISKKNGKSSLSAGVSLFHLLADQRIKTPKVFTAANNEEQAKICVNMAGQIADVSDEIKENSEIRFFRYGENIVEVINDDKGARGNGFIKALSKEGSDSKAKTAGGKHGINASLGVVDEFGMSQDHGASKTIDSSMVSRPERLMLYITTAGYNLEGPCFRELRASGIKVLDGVITMDNYFMLIFEIDRPVNEKGEEQEITIDWLIENPEVWGQSNPNIDVSVQRDALMETLQEAKQYGGKQEADAKTLNFNLWVESAETFIPAEIWDTNSHGLEAEGDCYGGLEVGPSGEISAFCLLFPGDVVKVKMLFFIAGEALNTQDFYRDNKQFIKVDPGNEVDVDIAVQWIIEEIQNYNMHSFCFANTQKNNSIVQGIIKAGYQGNPLSQGMSGIAEATQKWEKLLRAGQIEHFGNPILKYHNSNCLAIRKEQGTRIEKNGKVLGIYACLNAVAQWDSISATETDDKMILSW